MAAVQDRHLQKRTILRQVYETNRAAAGAAPVRVLWRPSATGWRASPWPRLTRFLSGLILLLIPAPPFDLISAGAALQVAPATPMVASLTRSGTAPWSGIAGARADSWMQSLATPAQGVYEMLPQFATGAVRQPLAANGSGTGSVPSDYALFADLSLPMAGLFGLGVKTIVIDPGHGGKDSGAVGAQGLAEKEVVLDIALRLREYLRAGEPGARVLLTRADDRFLTLRQRVAFANDNDADLFVSLHVNALPEPWHAFIETYYFGPPADEVTRLLAEKENRNSDYALSDFQRMISRISDTFKQQESARLAERLQTDLFANLKRHQRPLVNRGTRTAPFVVLLGSRMPSVLVEITSISNDTEEALLATEGYRDEIARYLAAGLTKYIKGHDVKLAEGASYGKEQFDRR